MSALRMNLCKSWILRHPLASSGNQVKRSLDLVQVVRKRFNHLSFQDEAGYGILELAYYASVIILFMLGFVIK